MVQPLENVMEQIHEQEEENLQHVFAVTDLETATEASRRIAYFNEKMAEIDVIIEKQIAPFLEKIERIKMWGEEAKKEYQEKQVHYANHLEMYMREEVKRQLEAGKKPKKTIKLPYGSISLKKQQPEYLRDELQLIEYARENDLVKVKEEVNWAELKKQCQVHEGVLIDSNRQIVPGVEVVERSEKFELKID
jgi:hypothetical protein